MTDPTQPIPQPDRIVISSDDLAAPGVDERVRAMADAQKVALVREVGAPTKSSGTLRAILVLTLGGLVGGLLAFLVQRVLFSAFGLFDDNVFLNNMGTTFIFALFIGVSVALAEVVSSGTWNKVWLVAAVAIPTAILAALIIGFITHLYYSAALDWLYNSAVEQGISGNWSDEEFESFISLRMHPIRGFAWLMVGVSAGIACGVAARSWKKLGLGVLGGAIGGFVGGFLFDFFQFGDETFDGETTFFAPFSEFLAQLVGICIVGVLIGLAMGIVEQAGKSRWIEIVSGGLAGKQFILYKSSITLGSAPSADITLIKDSQIPPVAAVMRTKGQRCQLDSADLNAPVVVNGTAAASVALADGDIVTFGSTQLRFREKNSQEKVPGALRS
jgi:hypothetical protein